MAAGKTLKSIIISCNVRLKPLSVDAVSDLVAYDEMALDSLGSGEGSHAIFASMSDSDSTFDFLFALLMWQATSVLYKTALDRFGGALKRPVHFLLEPPLHLFPIPEEAVKGQANGIEATGDGGSTINLGDGVTHEFVVLQEGVEELHLRAKLRRRKVLGPDPQRLRDVFQDFLLWLAVAQLVAAQGALADAAELCQLLLGELPLLPELLDLAGV